jgi:hypothetical protein
MASPFGFSVWYGFAVAFVSLHETHLCHMQVPTMWPMNKRYLAQVMETWGARCDKIKFFVRTNSTDECSFTHNGITGMPHALLLF